MTKITEKKVGKNWVVTDTNDDKLFVAEMLISDLKGRFIYHAPYIKSVRRSTNYISEKIIVTYDNGYRPVYYLTA